jgi:chromosome segregation protein
LEFDEVAIARHIARDGTNDYFINGSAVRLKDISALLGRVGLGLSNYHIISQGAADRLLWASSLERRSFIEEALGLKIYQTKREEAEKKLAETETNMDRILILQKELAPRVHYLKTQVDKMRKEEALRAELARHGRDYCARESAALEEQRRTREKEETPISSRRKELEKDCARLRARIEEEEQKSKNFFEVGEKETTEEKRLHVLEDRRGALERELGRIEGKQYREQVKDISNVLSDMKDRVTRLLSFSALEEIKHGLRELLGFILEYMAPVSQKEKDEERSSVSKGIASVQAEAAALRARIRAKKERHAALFEELHRLRETLRRKDQEFFGVKEMAAGYAIAREQWQRRFDDFETLRKEAWLREASENYLQETAAAWETDAQWQDHRRALERSRLKAEEIGHMDQNLTKEFNDVSERERFLEKEYNDLFSTKTSLAGLTQELITRLQHDFTEGLDRINGAFASFFSEMFRGGEAKLVCDEGEACPPERRGVEIEVSLPRKRIKSLEALSGGERALTAIALLFAISQVHPPPFLVLDETDAALDEANSRRYGAMLEELSKRTQLVVVTHNRETMKRADVLYGVTMGSEGISRLLSVKLDEVKNEMKEV